MVVVYYTRCSSIHEALIVSNTDDPVLATMAVALRHPDAVVDLAKVPGQYAAPMLRRIPKI